MARIDHVAALRGFLAGERIDIGKTLRALPASIEVPLATAVVCKLMALSTFGFGRSCQRLPIAVIRSVLAEQVAGPSHLFLRLAVTAEDDPGVASQWVRALVALLDLDLRYAWGSKQRRAKLQALARDPQLLQAIQGTVAHSTDAKADMLAVLVADGGDASYDALIGHIDRAFIGRDRRLDLLGRLRTHAKSTPALDALFAEVDGALDERKATSPALALGPIIGIGTQSALWFSALVTSREKENPVRRVQAHVKVDSRQSSWFSVSISTVVVGAGRKTTHFDSEKVWSDTLELGTCLPAELPAYLTRAANKLRCTWNPITPGRSNLRGANRKRLAAWLEGR